MSSLPSAFVERLSQIIREEDLPIVLGSFRRASRFGIRVNTLLVSLEEAIADLERTAVDFERIPWYSAGFSADFVDRATIMELALYKDRKLYFQNPSSMVPVLELDLEPGQTVLDLAAAPGSKTLQIVAALDGDGEVAAVEIVRKRFFKLKRNLEDHGAKAVRVYLQDGRRADRYRPSHFDRVLLDAPCSTEGRFIEEEPRTYRYWSVRKVREMAFKQKQLIESAIRCTKPGGLIIYSTCSFSPEENEEVVQHALDVFGDSVTIEPTRVSVSQYADGLTEWIGRLFDPQIRNAKRIVPDGTFEAFFVCRIRRA